MPYTDNFFATLNSAVFSDGSFCYIPKGVRCPMELSTYFRINQADTGQFERTLIVADEGRVPSATSRGARPPSATGTSSTPPSSSWWPSTTPRSSTPPSRTGTRATSEGKGGIYNFVTKRGKCAGAGTRRSPGRRWRPGSAITWKYPSCLLLGDDSVGEFYSVAVTANFQQADTGTKMIHVGKNTRSTIVSKGISAGHGQNTYRGAVEDRQERARGPATTRSATRS